MAAAASLIEFPPLTTLTVVRDDAAAALTQAERLVAENRHEEAADSLEALWADVRGDAALALRQRLALSWVEMYRGNLDDSAELLAIYSALPDQKPHRIKAARFPVIKNP